MEVYWFSGSATAWRVLLALEIKGVAYTSRKLEGVPDCLRTPEFLALNPRGKVPVIRDGDHVLPESLAILQYIDRRHPEPPLFGGDAAEASLIWKAMLDFDLYSNETLTFRFILPIFFGRTEAEADDIKAAAGEIHAVLRTYEDRLGRGDWLVAGRLSAADVAIYPVVEAMLRAAGKDAAAPLDLGLLPFGAHYPRLQAWRDRIAALPGAAHAYPPHWREDKAAAE